MKKFLTFILIIVLSASLCACGSRNKYAEYSISEDEYTMPASVDGFAQGTTVYDDVNTSYLEERSISYNEPSTDKIIYSADISIETTSFDKALDEINSLVSSVGGFIESSSISNSSYYAVQSGDAGYRSAYYTVRVPVESFNDMVSSVSDLGNIPYCNIYTDNVTKQYYDTEARLNNYTLQEERLLELLEKANSVSDIIEIESQLSETRYEIESLQSNLDNLDSKISYSSIYLSISEVGKISSKSPSTFGYRILNSLRSGLDFLINSVIWLIGAIPVIIILSGAGFGIYKAIKKFKSKKK